MVMQYIVDLHLKPVNNLAYNAYSHVSEIFRDTNMIFELFNIFMDCLQW